MSTLLGRKWQPAELLLLFQFDLDELLCFQSCHAAGGRRGDRLPVGSVLHVPGVENPRHAGTGAPLGNDVAVLVEFELPLENSRVRDMTDGHEDSLDRVKPGLTRLDVSQRDAGDHALFDVVNFLDDRRFEARNSSLR